MQQFIGVGGFANQWGLEDSDCALPLTIQQTFGAMVSKNTNTVGIVCLIYSRI
jgi:hypothetical protein